MRVHHVQIMIPEGREEEAGGYYQGLLGLEPIPRPDGLGGSGLWFRCGDLEFHLGVERELPRETRAHIAFSVPDLSAVRARLEGADFEVRAAPPVPGMKRFHTRDPFGNRLEFIQEAGT